MIFHNSASMPDTFKNISGQIPQQELAFSDPRTCFDCGKTSVMPQVRWKNRHVERDLALRLKGPLSRHQSNHGFRHFFKLETNF